ncbi:Dna2/Cas4 domain-containing protein [Clostridioides difficile]
MVNLINSDKAPCPDLKKGCKKCAYYEYCYI